MKKLFGFFQRREVISFLGLLALAVLIWYVGPLFAFAGKEPLASVLSRSVAIAVVFALGGGNLLRKYWVARRSNWQMLQEIGTMQPSAAELESAEELAELRQRFEDALNLLKNARFGPQYNRQYLYQLPWYIIIGPPGVGKTTALVNSGLHFPLGDRLGMENKIQGIGGTRNCDWWFTDEAVLLDTAGRYTTQDSYEHVDRTAWLGFLELLKKYRKRRPINGILIAISIADLMQQSESERAEHVAAIKRRLREMCQQFRIRFPIYVLFTKCDLIAGFVEFFDNLGREERAQVWGMTFPVSSENPNEALDRFATEFTLLEQRLNSGVIKRLQEERNLQKRSLIYNFPLQFGSLKESIEHFIDALFRSSRFEEPLFLRGIYFTSGTQEGTPIDRLMGSLASTFGLERQALTSASGIGKGYFLTRLFRNVIFQEAALAGTNLQLERQRRWLQWGLYGGALFVLGLALAGWSISYMRNLGYVENVNKKIQKAREEIQQVYPQVGGREAEQHLLAILPALEAAQGIQEGGGSRKRSTSWLVGLGLNQGNKLGSEAERVYRRLLDHLFLPLLMMRLEEQLRHMAHLEKQSRQGSHNSNDLYETLKVYLMLDDPAYFNPETVKAWMAADWGQDIPTREERQQLQVHLEALLEELPSPLPVAPDQALISQARAILSRTPLAERAYAQLKGSEQSSTIPSFRVDLDVEGATQVFVGRNGRGVTEVTEVKDIPGFFTYEGYHKVFSKQIEDLAKQLTKEGWILGKSQATLEREYVKLTEEVLNLYVHDYIQHWEELLADIDIITFENARHAEISVDLLSGTDSPIRRLLQAVEQETTLSREQDMQPEVADDLSAAMDVASQSNMQAWQAIRAVEEHFARRHQQVRSDSGTPPPLDETLSLLEGLYGYMRDVANASEQGIPLPEAARGHAGAKGIIQSLRDKASRQPKPLNRWLRSVADNSSSVLLESKNEHLNSVWTSEVLPFYRQALHNRYPLVRSSQQDTTLEDFGHFFGQGGLIDNFFQQHLSSFVDTTKATWQWRPSVQEKLGISSQTLREFQRAAVIRDAFFGAGGQIPAVRFELTPDDLDKNIRQFSLFVGEQEVTYRHGPVRPYSLQWPSPRSSEVRIRISPSPPAASERTTWSETGPWAWFRLLDKAQVAATNQPERFKVTFTLDGRTAIYILTASSVRNPFQLEALEKFRCPERL
jgi:type VI secretion system protein ImpL